MEYSGVEGPGLSVVLEITDGAVHGCGLVCFWFPLVGFAQGVGGIFGFPFARGVGLVGWSDWPVCGVSFWFARDVGLVYLVVCQLAFVLFVSG